MSEEKEVKQDFREAAEALPQTPFALSLNDKYGPETARNVFRVFRQMGLPAPETLKEYMAGAQGEIAFLNEFGLVIRIEKSRMDGSDRINNSPWVLRPIAGFNAGSVILEIIPAIGYETDLRNRNAVHEWLLQEGIKFWDFNIRNIGRIPVKTPAFPEGIPAVIDRPSVRAGRDKDGDEIRQARLRMTEDDRERYQQAVEAEKNLYGPLRRLFLECQKTQNMKPFWDMCRIYVRDKKLIAGWNEANANVEWPEDFDDQANYAANVATHYEARLRSIQQPVSSSAPAVRQLPRQSI